MEGNCSMACMMEMMGMMDMMNKLMTFHFSASNQLVLFDSWKISSPGDLVGAIVAVFFMAVFYEGLKTLREYLVYLDMKRLKPSPRANIQADDKAHYMRNGGNGDGDKTQLVMSDLKKRPMAQSNSYYFKYYSISVTMHLLQSFLHVVQVGWGYILMLVAMTFNGWLFLSVCFGAGVGYLLFAKTRHLMGNFRDRNEPCH